MRPERYITMIPEIEMPGHSSAAIAVLPFLKLFPQRINKTSAATVHGVEIQRQTGSANLGECSRDVFCAGKEIPPFNF